MPKIILRLLFHKNKVSNILFRKIGIIYLPKYLHPEFMGLHEIINLPLMVESNNILINVLYVFLNLSNLFFHYN